MPVVDTRNVHRARRDQIDALLAFQAQAYGPDSSQSDRSRFDWMYRRGEGAGDPLVYVFELRGKIVGQIGLLPCDFVVAGKRVKGHWVPDLMVLPEYRRLGVGVHLLQAAESLGDVVMASGVSDDLEPALRRRCWFDIGNIPSWVLPLNPAPLLGQTLSNRTGNAAWANALSDALAPAGRAGRPIVTSLLRGGLRLQSGLEIRAPSGHDVEALWDRIVSSDCVATPRTASWFEWRYGGRPGGYTFVGAFDGSHCVAYAALRVTQFAGHRRFGNARVGTLSDVLAVNRTSLHAILTAAAAAGGERGSDLVLAGGLQPGSDRWCPRPWFPVASKWMPMFWARDRDVRGPLSQRERWLFTRADGDGDAGF